MEILDDLPFVEIGHIRRSHGYKGHARVYVDEIWEEDFLAQRFVFLEIDGYKVPFDIEEIKNQKDLILKLSTIDSSEALSKYSQKKLYVLERNIAHAKSALDKSDEKSELIGMHIHDDTLGDLGPIIRIDEYPQQEMAILEKEDGTEVLIPLHEQMISSISQEEGKIFMDLPEGLV